MRCCCSCWIFRIPNGGLSISGKFRCCWKSSIGDGYKGENASSLRETLVWTRRAFNNKIELEIKTMVLITWLALVPLRFPEALWMALWSRPRKGWREADLHWHVWHVRVHPPLLFWLLLLSFKFPVVTWLLFVHFLPFGSFSSPGCCLACADPVPSMFPLPALCL